MTGTRKDKRRGGRRGAERRQRGGEEVKGEAGGGGGGNGPKWRANIVPLTRLGAAAASSVFMRAGQTQHVRR